MLSVQPDDVKRLKTVVDNHDAVQAHRLGPVMDDAAVRLAVGGTPVVETDRSALADPYESAIPEAVA